MEAFLLVMDFKKIQHVFLSNVVVLNLINGLLKVTFGLFLIGLQLKLLRFKSAQRSYKGPWLLSNSILHISGT